MLNNDIKVWGILIFEWMYVVDYWYKAWMRLLMKIDSERMMIREGIGGGLIIVLYNWCSVVENNEMWRKLGINGGMWQKG